MSNAPSLNAPPNSLPVNEAPVNGHKNFEEVTFKKHPKVKYWHNKKTGARQWHAPGTPKTNRPDVEVENSTVPPGWKKIKHRNNNSDPPLYWYESALNTAWELPKEEARIPQSKNNYEFVEDKTLPRGWKKVKARSNTSANPKYWYRSGSTNKAESMWNVPTEPAYVVVPNANLPRGWEKLKRANNTKAEPFYWYESKSGLSKTKKRPTESGYESVANANLPEGWLKMKHRNNKTATKGYWYETPDGKQKTAKRPASPANPVKANAPVNTTPKALVNNTASSGILSTLVANSTPPNSPKASVNNVFSPVFNQIGKVKNSLSALERNLKGGKTRKNRSRKNRSRKNRKN
jgi:hypothetical protein